MLRLHQSLISRLRSGCFSVSLAKSSAFSRRRKTPRDASRLVQFSPKGSLRDAQIGGGGGNCVHTVGRRLSPAASARGLSFTSLGEGGGPRQRWKESCSLQNSPSHLSAQDVFPSGKLRETLRVSYSRPSPRGLKRTRKLCRDRRPGRSACALRYLSLSRLRRQLPRQEEPMLECARMRAIRESPLRNSGNCVHTVGRRLSPAAS